MIRRLLRAGLIAWLGIWSLTTTSGDGLAQVIRAGPPRCKAVALTFDLCPVLEGTGYDAPLIELLVAKHIPATFFASGRWIARHDAEMKTLLAVPFFEIGTHGQVHAHLPALDEGRQRVEISGPVELLRTRYGLSAPLFRPPYGEYDDLTVEIVKAMGLRLILWNAVSGDPDPQLSKEQMLAHLAATIRGGSVIVFHANGKGKHTRDVVEALSQDVLSKQGLTPVTVTELLSCAQQNGQ